jgi:hypothetical protein
MKYDDIPIHPNPCSFKKACHTCTIVGGPDRPSMCQQLECEHYTPCKKCGANRPLTGTHLCASCSAADGSAVVRGDANEPDKVVPARRGRPITLKAEAEENDGSVQELGIEITLPGTPPSNYSDAEKAYYDSHWDQYKGYYRDPTAYAVLHNLIILEIELNWATGYLIQHRAQPDANIEKQRNTIIANMEMLRKQLPAREAQDLSDDEKSLAMIYDRYIEEKKKSCVSGVSRILSPEAVALAPAMHFPVNAEKLLQRLGCKMVDVNSAVEKIIADHHIPSSPESLLEFLGFFLKEKYALPFDENAIIDMEDEETEGELSTVNHTAEKPQDENEEE